jgi:hypothetical protein
MKVDIVPTFARLRGTRLTEPLAKLVILSPVLWGEGSAFVFATAAEKRNADSSPKLRDLKDVAGEGSSGGKLNAGTSPQKRIPIRRESAAGAASSR